MRSTLLTLGLFFYITNFLNAQVAVNFDGNNDVIQTNYSGVLGSANRTFEAMVFVSSSAPTSNLAILDYGLNAVGSRNTFAVSATRALTFVSGGTNANISSPGSAVPTDQWVHVAFVINNAIGFLYVDGVQVGTGSLSTVNTPAGNENVKIGQRVAGGSIPFSGTIDEVRVWSIARTQSEIQANISNELCSLDPNLQLYLRLNEGVAGANNLGVVNALDDSGNSYTATLSGFTLNGAASNWVLGNTITQGISSSNTIVSECDTYTWSVNSTTYTTSGNYSTVLAGANVNGCDSILNLDLTIFTANDLTTNVSDCDSYTWSVNGQTYTSTTTAVEQLTTGQGCSYTHTLNLTLGQSTSDTTTTSACDSYTWSANNQTYTTSGTFTESFANQGGCDSIVTLELTINSVDSSVTDNGDLTITANDATAMYQWLDCNNSYATIAGATAQIFATTVDGSFAVAVTSNGCTDTSECVVIDYANVDPIDYFLGTSLFPNPTTAQSTLAFGEEVSSATINIVDASGRVISAISVQNELEVTIELPEESGVYFVQVSRANHKVITLRLIKE